MSNIAIRELPATATDADKADCTIDLFRGDITIKSDIEKVFAAYANKGGIYGVIHVAAHKAVGESAEKPLQYYENNINATVNLLQVRALSSRFSTPTYS